MIKASELRIGNKFTMSGGTMVNTVFEIIDNTNRGKIEFVSPEHKLMYSHLILVEENGNQYKPFEIEGTPLTEEWILKFGFESIGELNPTFKLRNYLIELSIMRDYWVFRQTINKDDSLCLSQNLHHVHQLQNLYFALTGKELTPLK